MKAAVLAALGVCMVTHSAEAADTYAVRIVRDVSYIQGASDPDHKDKLDLYLPEGRTNVPVIVSYYGGALTAGDKSENAFVGQRFASAGIATAVVNYRMITVRLTPDTTYDREALVRERWLEFNGRAATTGRLHAVSPRTAGPSHR